MKLMLICAFLLSVAINLRSANAAASITFTADPSHPGKCVIKPDLILSDGDKVSNPFSACGEVSCGPNSRTYFVSCPPAIIRTARKGCQFTDYLNAKYPKCCRQRTECPRFKLFSTKSS